MEQTDVAVKPERLQVDIDKPRWDQSTFVGRLKHFATITDMRKLFASEKKLDKAKELVNQYRCYCS